MAVLFIGAALFLFNFSSFAITEATYWFERASYSLIALPGGYLLWQKGVQPFLRRNAAVAHEGRVMIHSADSDHGDAHASCSHHGHDHSHTHVDVYHTHSAEHHHHGHRHHDHDHSCSCSGHAVDPGTMKDPLSLKSAWAAIASVGLRSCSGALIVLVFASAQGLFWVGVASTFAMAPGTAITVTSLATIALGAKGLATKYLSVTGGSGLVFRSVEVFGASLIFLLGITLLAASMQG